MFVGAIPQIYGLDSAQSSCTYVILNNSIFWNQGKWKGPFLYFPSELRKWEILTLLVHLRCIIELSTVPRLTAKNAHKRWFWNWMALVCLSIFIQRRPCSFKLMDILEYDFKILKTMRLRMMMDQLEDDTDKNICWWWWFFHGCLEMDWLWPGWLHLVASSCKLVATGEENVAKGIISSREPQMAVRNFLYQKFWLRKILFLDIFNNIFDIFKGICINRVFDIIFWVWEERSPSNLTGGIHFPYTLRRSTLERQFVNRVEEQY